MITLNQIAYNIQNLMYPNTLTLEGEVPIAQIKHWIHYHRAKLITENASKGILSFDNIYQKVNSHRYLPANDFSNLENKFYNDFYGRQTSKMENRGDWRNLGHLAYNIPEIVMMPIGSAIKEVALYRNVMSQDSGLFAETENDPIGVGQKIYISRRSKSEKEFSSFNKFTNNNKPFYIIDRSVYTATSNDNLDGGLRIQIWGIRRSPNNFGDLKIPGAEELEYGYLLSYNAILKDPTQIDFLRIDVDTDEAFNDDLTPYPIPGQYVKDLIERVVSTEGNIVLKTMQNES